MAADTIGTVLINPPGGRDFPRTVERPGRLRPDPSNPLDAETTQPAGHRTDPTTYDVPGYPSLPQPKKFVGQTTGR